MNTDWIWVFGILLVLSGVASYMQKTFLSWLLAFGSLGCLFMFFIPPLVKNAKEVRQFHSTCVSAGNTTIVSREDSGWNRVRCVKPDYQIDVPSSEDYCATHGGQYMFAEQHWMCVKKESLVDIKFN